MSYNKIKNISIKKDCVMITTAESNVYPITYSTFEWTGATELLRAGKREQLIGEIVMDFLDGNFHSTNDTANRKYLYALTLNREEVDRLQEIRWGWNSDGERTREHSLEERRAAKEQLTKLLYQNYLQAEAADREHKGEEYVIKLTCGYLYKPTKYGFKYVFSERQARKYNYLIAQSMTLTHGFQKRIDAEYAPKAIRVA